jgi:hypothetical protein
VFAVSGERHDGLDQATGFAGILLKPVNLDSLAARLAALPRRPVVSARLRARLLWFLPPQVHTRLIETKADCALERDDEIGLADLYRLLADRTARASLTHTAYDLLQPSKWWPAPDTRTPFLNWNCWLSHELCDSMGPTPDHSQGVHPNTRTVT